MVAHCLQQLFEGKTLTEKTLIKLERWAEQYPYHLSPTLIRLWNDRLEGALDNDESKLNRLAFFMADRRQLFALVKGEGIPEDNVTVTLAKKELTKSDVIDAKQEGRHSIPSFDLEESLESSDKEISSLGDFLASLAAEVPIQPPTPSAMDGDLETVLSSEDVQAIIQRSKTNRKESKPKEFVSETYATILRSQGRYEEAIEVYNQLIIENPKKKRFFADQIEELLKK